MLDSWPRDKLVAVALLIAAMTPDSKVAIAAIKREDLLPDHAGRSDFMRLQFGQNSVTGALRAGRRARDRVRDGLPQCARAPTGARRLGGSRCGRPIRRTSTRRNN